MVFLSVWTAAFLRIPFSFHFFPSQRIFLLRFHVLYRQFQRKKISRSRIACCYLCLFNSHLSLKYLSLVFTFIPTMCILFKYLFYSFWFLFLENNYFGKTLQKKIYNNNSAYIICFLWNRKTCNKNCWWDSFVYLFFFLLFCFLFFLRFFFLWIYLKISMNYAKRKNAQYSGCNELPLSWSETCVISKDLNDFDYNLVHKDFSLLRDLNKYALCKAWRLTLSLRVNNMKIWQVNCALI